MDVAVLYPSIAPTPDEKHHQCRADESVLLDVLDEAEDR